MHGAAEGGHGAGGEPADLGVVAAGRDQEQQRPPLLVEDRRDDGDVGKVRAPVVGVVDGVGVARPHGALVAPQHLLDGLAHGAEVDGDVGGVGDQVALGVEQGAGEVEAFLDVDGVGGVLEADAHLLGDRHEEVVEDLQHHGVDLRAHRDPAGARPHPGEQEVAVLADHGPPAGVDDGRRVGLRDHGGPVHGVARAHPVPAEQGAALPPALRVQRHLGGRPQRTLAGRRLDEVACRRPRGADRLDRDRLDDQRLVHGEGVTGAVLGGERRAHNVDLAHRHGERRVGSGVADVDAGDGPDGVVGDAVLVQLGARQFVELVAHLQQGGQVVLGEPALHGTLPHGGGVGQAYPVRGQHTGQRRHDDAVDGQRVGDRAGVLATGAAEAGEGVSGDVVAALNGDLLDGAGHVQDGDLQEARGDLLRAAAVAGRGGDFPGEPRESGADGLGVQRLVAVRAEDGREMRRLDAAEHHVGVGDGQRTAAAVAGRAGVGAGGIGADAIALTVEVQDRAAARGHCVDVHHRGPHPHTRHLGAEDAFQLARAVRHVGGGAAHVEADDTVVPGLPGGAHHADDSAGRAGEHGVLSPEVAGLPEPAVGLHEHQPDAPQFGGHLVHVTAQDRRQVRVDHGGVAPRHQFDQRADLVGAADLAEAGLACRRRDGPLVGGMAVAVQQDDGDAPQTVPAGLAQGRSGGGDVEGADDRAVRVDAFGDLDDTLVQRLGKYDLAVEEPRPVLVGDAQRVAEAFGDDQRGRLSLALQEGVGGDRGAHLDGGDPVGGHGFAGAQAQHAPDALDGGVPVMARVVGEQFARLQGAVRSPRDDVGEGAAPVDPELPASGHALIVPGTSLAGGPAHPPRPHASADPAVGRCPPSGAGPPGPRAAPGRAAGRCSGRRPSGFPWSPSTANSRRGPVRPAGGGGRRFAVREAARGQEVVELPGQQPVPEFAGVQPVHAPAGAVGHPWAAGSVQVHGVPPLGQSVHHLVQRGHPAAQGAGERPRQPQDAAWVRQAGGEHLRAMSTQVAHDEVQAVGDGLDVEAAAQRVVGTDHHGGDAGRHEQPGAAVTDEIERTAGGGGDHGQPAGHRLLDGLAERLEGPGVDEHVEGGVDPREVVAGTAAEERRTRQHLAQPLGARAVADDDHLHAGQPAGTGQQLDVLLRGEPADIADQYLPLRGEFPAQRLVAVGGVEARGVHAARPQVHARDAMRLQVAPGRAGRGERAVGGRVHGTDAAPRGALPAAHIGTGVPCQVGLEDGDRGDVLPGGCGHAAHPEDERAGEVDEFGSVRGDRRRGPAAGKRHPHLRVAGQRHRRHPDDGAGFVAPRGLVRAGRRDHQRLVASADQVFGRAQRAVGHSVDVGREGLRDDRYSHRDVVGSPGVVRATWIFPPGERVVSVGPGAVLPAERRDPPAPREFAGRRARPEQAPARRAKPAGVGPGSTSRRPKGPRVS